MKIISNGNVRITIRPDTILGTYNQRCSFWTTGYVGTEQVALLLPSTQYDM